MFRDYKLYLIENPHLLEEGDYAKYLDVYDDVHILFPTPLADVADEAFERASRFGNVKAMRAAAHAFHKINNTIDSTPDPRERKFLEMAATHCDRQSQQDMIQITCLENNGTANKRYWDLFTGRANCTPPTVSDAAAVSSKLL
jgi:hypothetical protein